MPYNIQGLKKRQKEDKECKENLLTEFKKFRASFIELLVKFSNDAEEQELTNFVPIKATTENDDLIEYSMNLNSMDLIIISTNDVYQTNPIKGFVGAKIFLYRSNSYDSKPLVSITFSDSCDGLFMAGMDWFTMEGPRDIIKPYLLKKDNLENDGEEFAESLLGHISLFESIWRDNPKLGPFRDKTHRKKNFGFEIPNKEI